MSTTRQHMRLPLTPIDAPLKWPFRALTPHDAPALATLMLDAYRGTIDDEGETPEDALAEIQRTFAGDYGSMLFSASYTVEHEARLLAATLVTLWRSAPLLAFVMTAPDAKGRGLGAYLIQQSVATLFSQGHRELHLFVTDGNAPAQHIYQKLGFRVVETLAASG